MLHKNLEEKGPLSKVPVLEEKLALSNLQSHLFKLPSALLFEVSTCLEKDLKTQAALTQTCKRSAVFFQPELTKVRLKALLQAVVYGNMDKAKKIIASNPKLLLQRAQVTDYSGRTIEGTAYQLALGAEDVSRPEHKDEGMADMIECYLKRLPNGESEIKKQQAQQFPLGYEEAEQQKKAADSKALQAVIKAIEDAKDGDDCEEALAQFREYLKPTGVIQQGKHFNANLLLEAFTLYDEKYDHLGGWDSPKNNLFWRKVIGYIQRYLPACYAQVFCQSLYDVVERREKLQRSLKFKYDSSAAFFPLDSDLSFRLGFSYGAAACGAGGRGAARCIASRLFSNLISSKNNIVTRAYATAEQSVEAALHDPVSAKQA